MVTHQRINEAVKGFGPLLLLLNAILSALILLALLILLYTVVIDVTRARTVAVNGPVVVRPMDGVMPVASRPSPDRVEPLRVIVLGGRLDVDVENWPRKLPVEVENTVSVEIENQSPIPVEAGDEVMKVQIVSVDESPTLRWESLRVRVDR